MTVQMTVRVDNTLAAFVDEQVAAGGGSRADVINHALRRELRRRIAARDALIYAATEEADLSDDAYAQWAERNASQMWAELD